jgi:quinol monooxygenase YgiN
VSVRVITHIQTRPGAAEDFKVLWDRKRYDDVIGLPGCDQYELFQSALEPERLVVLENWQSRSAYLSAWKIVRVQVMVGEDLLAAPTDQPHSGHRTEIYWNIEDVEPGTIPAQAGRLVVNQNIDPANRDALLEAWKAASASASAGAVEHDLLLATRNLDNIAELGTWTNGAALAEYARGRFSGESFVGKLIASPGERMSGEAGVELYAAPSFSRWNGTEWAEAAGVAG